MTWRSLKVPPAELRLDFTLPTGQSFRWKKHTDGCYVGVVRNRAFQLRETAKDVQYRSLIVMLHYKDDIEFSQKTQRPLRIPNG